MDTFSANSFKPARAATGLVDLSFVRRARVVSLRPFVPRRALGGLLSSPANVRSRGRSIPRPRQRRRVDDARAGARRERGADEEKFPHLKPPLRRPPTRPARASRLVEIAPDRSRDPLAIVRSVVDRASSAPSSHRARARGTRDKYVPLGGLRRLEGANVTENGGLRDGRHGRARARVSSDDARGRRSIGGGDSPWRGYVLNPKPSIAHPPDIDIDHASIQSRDRVDPRGMGWVSRDVCVHPCSVSYMYYTFRVSE